MKMVKNTKRPALKRITAVAVMMAFVLIAGCSKEEAYRQIKVYEIDGSATVTREGTGEVEPYVNMMLQNKDKASSTNFCLVSGIGDAANGDASFVRGVRPAFLIAREPILEGGRLN